MVENKERVGQRRDFCECLDNYDLGARFDCLLSFKGSLKHLMSTSSRLSVREIQMKQYVAWELTVLLSYETFLKRY